MTDEQKQAAVQLFFHRLNLIYGAENLTKDQVNLLIYLAHRDNPTRGCFPGQGDIASCTRIHRKQQLKAIKDLERREILFIQRKYKTSNIYEINDLALERIQKVVSTVTPGVPRRDARSVNQLTPGVPRRDARSVNQLTPGVPPKNPPKNPVKNSPKKEGAIQESKTGEGVANPTPDSTHLSDYIKNEEISNLFRTVEVIRLSEGKLPMVTSLNPDLASVRWTTLLKEIKETTHSLPDSWDIINVSNDEEFIGLKSHSWGMMVSKDKYQITKTLLLNRLENKKLMTRLEHPSPDDLLHRQLDEQRRDSVMQTATVTWGHCSDLLDEEELS